MIDIITLGAADAENEKLKRILTRGEGLDNDALIRADAIVRDVAGRGDPALIEHTQRLDGIDLTPETLRVDPTLLKSMAGSVDAKLVDAMREAAGNIRRYHEQQLTRDWEIEGLNGVRLGQRVRPLDIVGLYVPGGTAAYPSTVMMNAIPAQVAGVGRLVVATPPAQFAQSPVIAAILVELGLMEVYTVGGAQAIAALAYGTNTIPRVDKIVGPGNRYVAAAKKLVFGTVDIDSIAGPSEIVVIADESAPPEFVAADLLSQAEHSEDASAILITPSQVLATAVLDAISRQARTLSRAEIVERSLAAYGAIFIVDSIEAACRLADRIAPEHVEVMTRNNEETAARIAHAGAIFVGPYSPEPVGDYFAGSNHVLPTGGTARFSSALGVYDFLKRTSIVRYTEAELRRTAASIGLLARAEGFDAHARAAAIRLDSE
jgi:histidinol dehydrogenase